MAPRPGSRPVSLREEHAQQTRDALITAGIERFAGEGYAATSVARIVEDARVSKGAFYHHFADKKALLAAVASAVCDGSDAVIRETVDRHTGDSDPEDVVAATLDAAMEAVRTDDRYRRIRQEAAGVLSPEERRELDARHRDPLVTAVLGRLRDRGTLRADLDPEVTTTLVIALLETTKDEVTVAEDPEATYARFRPVLLQFIRSLLVG